MLSSAKTTSTTFVETVGLAAVKKALEAKDVRVQLKHLATQHSIVLVKFNERASDPRLTVDYSFFHSKGSEVPHITVDQLFQGFPVLPLVPLMTDMVLLRKFWDVVCQPKLRVFC